MRSQAYPWYGDRPLKHGISVLTDQQIGGALMMLTDLIVMLSALAFFFWRAAQDNDRAQERELAAAARG
jgi:hypothetical protein